MDQIKVGKFIADMRKEQNFTQKQLAEQLNLSDKAISKWECGKSMPDTSILLDLCQLLKINVNELLSGERLSLETYPGKAEENMLNLIQETQEAKSKRMFSLPGAFLGITFFIVFLLFLLLASNAAPLWFLDMPVLIGILGITFIVLISSGGIEGLLSGFVICFRKKAVYTQIQLKNAVSTLQLAILTVLLSGGITFLIGFTTLSVAAENLTVFLPNLAVASLSLLYSFILALFLLPVKKRLETVLNEGDII